MAGPRPWIVLNHDAIQKLEDDLWTVSGALPRSPVNRRMAIVRLSSGELVFHNAIPLDELSMREVEAFGRPAFLVVPNRFHRLDIHAWKARYPTLRLVCPPAARPHVERVAKVDGGLDALPRDPALEAIPLEGTRSGEPALAVRGGGARLSLVFGDAVMNIAAGSGIIVRLLGSSGGPKVTPLFRLLAVRDARALAAHLDRLADMPGLARLVPSHGDLVEGDAAAVLREVAARARRGASGRPGH
jgi:hypothetical protein